ncbi:hypothetical protein LCGC14_1005800 [marine sediment metagenome]|uniref:Uncharacterized protein n=1 Tax=marine sediment metagenome TaxID=412755 RepID=A0A0F9QJZ2_9ZZZZ
MPCNCHEDQRVTICARCEKEDTGALSQAFVRGGFKVDLEYCSAHKT